MFDCHAMHYLKYYSLDTCPTAQLAGNSYYFAKDKLAYSQQENIQIIYFLLDKSASPNPFVALVSTFYSVYIFS